MQIKLYNMTEELIKVDKTITDEIIVTGTLRDKSDVVEPVFLYESATGVNRNYAYIPDFGRYYFIKQIGVVRNNLYQLQLSIDVLKTYSTQIKALTCIIGRQQFEYNMYLDDPDFKAYTYSRIQTKNFPSGFSSTPQFLLTVAGGV